MSRILFLLPSVPVPLDAGAKIRNYGLLKLLGAEHRVDAVAFGDSQAESELSRLAHRIAVVPEPPARSAARRALELANSPLPDMVHRLWSPVFMRTVACLARDEVYDAVQAEGIEVARYLSAVPASRRIYDAHNAEFLLQRRLATAGPHLAALPRLYSRLQWHRLERFERQLVRESRLSLAVSNHDANQLRALAGEGANVGVVPSGIDTAAYPFAEPDADQAPNLLFLGKLDFRPNAEALRWFVDDVLRHLHGVRLFAVGAAPPRWLVEVGQHNDCVAVTGFVPDERPYLQRCGVLVLPLRTGGGSRLKALVAMSSGVPIVSTRLGMEGLDVEPGVHYLMAESAADWVTNLKRLMGDAALRERLARNGRAVVEARYSRSAIQADVRTAYAWLNA